MHGDFAPERVGEQEGGLRACVVSGALEPFPEHTVRVGSSGQHGKAGRREQEGGGRGGGEGKATPH